MQAQQAAERENARRMRAGLGIAQLGELAQQSALRDIQTQFDLGEPAALQQAGLKQGVKRLAQLCEPYQRFSFLSDIWRGTVYSGYCIVYGLFHLPRPIGLGALFCRQVHKRGYSMMKQV